MMSLQGVPSSLIARNQSWVRRQAAALARRLPSNVEQADLIQVGLIAVAQSALAFRWDGEHDSDEGREAFLRYARTRVKGAMLDELRQLDHLGRAERRKVKAVQIARERWRSSHAAPPTLTDLSSVCGIDVDEIARLEHAAALAQTESLSDEAFEDRPALREPATADDEVEARVDTGLLLRRLETFFAGLPERERQVIDAYLGVGMTPVELASATGVSTARISQMYKSVCRRIAVHLGHAERRATDRVGSDRSGRFEEAVVAREAELARTPGVGNWAQMLEKVLATPHVSSDHKAQLPGGDERLVVDCNTRWG